MGAGCGGPELITRKGQKLLERCDVLLYDSLADPGLLELVPGDCEKIDVGKRYAGKAAGQEEINRLLIEKAGEGKLTVRLKGGDPYVFGRGGEEMQALVRAGIACETVPGISSALAVPAAAGIPVTHRQLSRCVTIFTASSAAGAKGGEALTGLDYGALVRLQGTLVILMGLHHLEELAKRLIGSGMSPTVPAAVITEGARPGQKCVRAPLASIAGAAREAGLKPPAVIVIGETAALELPVMTTGDGQTEDDPPPGGVMNSSDQEAFSDQEASSGKAVSSGKGASLAGLRVGVTGTAGFAARMSAVLRSRGACPVDVGFLRAVRTDEELPETDGYRWLVFTSPNGADFFLEEMKRRKMDFRSLAENKIAVIGPGTAERLAERGLYADLLPEVYDAAHLGKALAAEMRPGERALLCRAGEGSPLLPEELKKAGKLFTDFPLYRLEEDPEKRTTVFRRLRQERIDYLLFGSASGVRTFMEASGGRLPAGVRLGCIGRQTAAALREYGREASAVAEVFTPEGLAAALEQAEREDKKNDTIQKTEKE